jgi:gamma-glutamylcyclotransferase (GGCT)/AIG2-like uncharacterized protein YtfP
MSAERHFHLFTYGTLRADGAAAELMAGCERVSEATVHGTLYDTGDFPALLLSGTDPVRGEIWRCPAEALARLDRYEGVGQRLFRRVGVDVDGIGCWAYVAGPALGPGLTPEARVRPGTGTARDPRSARER